MSITLFVSKIFDEHFNEIGEEIQDDEWSEFVKAQDNLRLITESHRAENPSTGEVIEISTSEGETEILIKNDWQPFLAYYNGELRMMYSEELDNPDDLIRLAIANVANHFKAIIRHDAGDEILKW